MGLGPASLYNAFGDKHALFTRCLDRYLDATMRERVARLEATRPPREALHDFFEEIIARSLADRHGCLMVNAAVELAPHDEAIGPVLAARLGELESFFARCVAAGQADGGIGRRIPGADLARMLLVTLLGLRVLSRARPEEALLRGAARAALVLLDPEETTG